MNSVKKILVFRLSAIGDIVLTTALICSLRKTYPDATIDFVVKRQFASILQCVPQISRVFQLDSSKGIKGLLALRKELQQQKYDVVLDIHKNWRSFFITYTIGAKKRYEYTKHVCKRWLLIKFKLDAYNVVRPVYKRFMDSAKELGVNCDRQKTELVVPSKVQDYVDAFLEERGIKPHKNIVVVCPGASFENKQYPIEHLTVLTQKILSDLHFQVVLLGGLKEKILCDQILESAQGSIISVAGKFDLSQSAALINRAQVTIVNDTGMLHVSEALNVPVVGFYGPTVRQFGYAPILSDSIMAQVELECRPCTKMGMNYCPKNSFDCLKKITPDIAFTYVQNIVKTRI